MKVLWFILTLIPAPFLFHYYEYGQYLKREEASYLLISSIVYVAIVGFLSSRVKIRNVILLNMLTALLSVILSMYFIADDGGWFKPFGRNFSVIFVGVVFLIGQLIVRFFLKIMIEMREY